jgi:hypothetical protein
MVQSSDKRSDMPRTLFKIILMLGLALAGVAAIAAEPQPTETASTTTCAKTTFEFGGRVVQNGEATDTWTLTCWRQPAQQAATPPGPSPAKPVDAMPVATQSMPQTGMALDGPRS